jgi:PIN domain nuclease of toxin-antitoxin system
MKILLDTCTFLWIVSDAPELTEAGKTVFSDPDNDVYLSSVSAWEILVKYLLGKLSISGSPECFIREQREQHDIDTLPLDEVSALHLPVLPKLHRDPFDRMLVCQAIEHNLTILTPDPMIIQYPIKVIW